MTETAERRLAIRDFISDKRETTIAEISEKFHISKSTVRRDLDAITDSTLFYMVQGNGGGIRAAEGWYASRRYFTLKQEELLRRLLPGLQPEEAHTMEGILAAFAKPHKYNEQGEKIC